MTNQPVFQTMFRVVSGIFRPLRIPNLKFHDEDRHRSIKRNSKCRNNQLNSDLLTNTIIIKMRN